MKSKNQTDAAYSWISASMKTAIRKMLLILLSVLSATGCSASSAKSESDLTENPASEIQSEAESETEHEKTAASDSESQSLRKQIASGQITKGQFVNGLKTGNVHYSLRLPADYDAAKIYPAFINLPGWGSFWFQGEGSNLKEAWAGQIAQDHPEMIVISMQLNGYDEQSADDTIAAAEYFLQELSIDPQRLYLQGYSAGGETGSMAVSKHPNLFAAFLEVSSKWDGDIGAVAKAGLPVAFAVAQDDSYYGSVPMEQTMQQMQSAYTRYGYENNLCFFLADPDWVSSHGFTDTHAAGNGFSREQPLMDWFFSWTLSTR